MELDLSEDVKLKDCEQLWLDEKENIMDQLSDLLSDSQRYNLVHLIFILLIESKSNCLNYYSER